MSLFDDTPNQSKMSLQSHSTRGADHSYMQNLYQNLMSNDLKEIKERTKLQLEASRGSKISLIG